MRSRLSPSQTTDGRERRPARPTQRPPLGNRVQTPRQRRRRGRRRWRRRRTELSDPAGRCRPPSGVHARSGSTAAIAPGTSLSSRLSVTGVMGSMAAWVRCTGTPSTSTAPPTTTRPSSGKAGQSTTTAPGHLAPHASSAPRSWLATEPRIVESIFTYSRSHPKATRPRTPAAVSTAASSSRAARTPVTTASSEGPSSTTSGLAVRPHSTYAANPLPRIAQPRRPRRSGRRPPSPPAVEPQGCSLPTYGVGRMSSLHEVLPLHLPHAARPVHRTPGCPSRGSPRRRRAGAALTTERNGRGSVTAAVYGGRQVRVVDLLHRRFVEGRRGLRLAASGGSAPGRHHGLGEQLHRAQPGGWCRQLMRDDELIGVRLLDEPLHGLANLRRRPDGGVGERLAAVHAESCTGPGFDLTSRLQHGVRAQGGVGSARDAEDLSGPVPRP